MSQTGLITKEGFKTITELENLKIELENLKTDFEKLKKTNYNIQKISFSANDVLLLEISDDLDIDDAHKIYQEVKQAFPFNEVLMANKHILKGIKVLS